MIKTLINGNFLVNSYLYVKNNQAIIVDPGEGIFNYLDEINKYEVIAILITHGHLDHIDGIGYFNAPIYISKDDYIFLTDNTLSLYSMCFQKPSYNFSSLDIRIIDSDILSIGPFVIKVIKTPGHTKGSLSYLIDNNLFSGDTLFKESIGRTDFPTGSEKDLYNSLKLLAKLGNEIIVYPGHNEKTTIGNEKKHNIFMKRN